MAQVGTIDAMFLWAQQPAFKYGRQGIGVHMKT